MLVGLPQKLKKKGEAEEMASLPSMYKFLSPTLWLHWIIYINTFHTEVEHFHLPWYEKMLGNLLQPFFFLCNSASKFSKNIREIFEIGLITPIFVFTLHPEFCYLNNASYYVMLLPLPMTVAIRCATYRKIFSLWVCTYCCHVRLLVIASELHACIFLKSA